MPNFHKKKVWALKKISLEISHFELLHVRKVLEPKCNFIVEDFCNSEAQKLDHPDLRFVIKMQCDKTKFALIQVALPSSY